jgi:hypothetical protein
MSEVVYSRQCPQPSSVNNMRPSANVLPYGSPSKLLNQFELNFVFRVYSRLSGYSPYQSDVNLVYVKFEAFTAVTMKNSVSWDMAKFRSCVNRRFGGTYRLHL